METIFNLRESSLQEYSEKFEYFKDKFKVFEDLKKFQKIGKIIVDVKKQEKKSTNEETLEKKSDEINNTEKNNVRIEVGEAKNNNESTKKKIIEEINDESDEEVSEEENLSESKNLNEESMTRLVLESSGTRIVRFPSPRFIRCPLNLQKECPTRESCWFGGMNCQYGAEGKYRYEAFFAKRMPQNKTWSVEDFTLEGKTIKQSSEKKLASSRKKDAGKKLVSAGMKTSNMGKKLTARATKEFRNGQRKSARVGKKSAIAGKKSASYPKKGKGANAGKEFAVKEE